MPLASQAHARCWLPIVTQGTWFYGVFCVRHLIGSTNKWLFGKDFINIIGFLVAKVITS